MPKVLVEVEIPDGYELADPAMRFPRLGEQHLDYTGVVATAKRDWGVFDFDQRCVILRPAWQWPSWLKAPWIAMDKDGEWCAHQTKPSLEEDWWDTDYGDEYYPLTGDDDNGWMLDFTPPTVSDWTQSLRKNPNVT